MFHLDVYKENPQKVSYYVPYAFLIEDGIVINKIGSFQRTVQFFPPDLNSSTDEEIDAISALLNDALKRLGGDWAYFFEVQRNKSIEYPNSEFPNKASELIDLERKKLLTSRNSYYINSYYITFTYMPLSENLKKAAGKFFDDETRSSYIFDLKEIFLSETKKIIDILKTIIHVYYLNEDETLEYLHHCVSTKRHFVKSPNIPVFIDNFLADQTIECGIIPKIGDSFVSIVSIIDFPQETYPRILKELDGIGCEYRWSTRFILCDNLDSKSKLEKLRKYWNTKRKSIYTIIKETLLKEPSDEGESREALDKIGECEAVQKIVSDKLAAVGYYTSSIVLWDDSLIQLREKRDLVEKIINSAGFTSKNETFNSIQAWFGSLPGNCSSNVRRFMMTTLNLMHLLPLSTTWCGPEKNIHLKGPPLFFARSCDTNTPFRFSNHVGDVGHSMIIGPTGTGKSVLLSFIAAQFLRYPNARVFFFDNGYSSRAITLLMNGYFYDLGADEISFQPFRNIDNRTEKRWALDWITRILRSNDINVSFSSIREIWTSLTLLSHLPKNQRTITGLVTLIQDIELREFLTNYTVGESFDLLDSEEDSIELSDFQCFEMGNLIKGSPSLVAPVLTYLFHKLENKFKDGVPTFLILDEAWLFLTHTAFSERIAEWLRTLRRSNVSVIFATQTIDDIAQGILNESCPTRIFLPNRKAKEPDIFNRYSNFGLNENQINIISTAIPKREYYLQSDMGCGKFDLDLGPVTLAFCSANVEKDLSILDQLKNENDEKLFIQNFLKMKGITYKIE